MVCTEDDVKKIIEKAYRKGLRDAQSTTLVKLNVRPFLLSSQVTAFEFYEKLRKPNRNGRNI